jgi:alpha-beta hydrolase superfamily lysophospholipase
MDRPAVIGAAIACVLLLAAWPAQAAEKVGITLRGKPITLEFYRPPPGASPKGTVLMGSGDVGWVGLGVDLSEFLAGQGFTVVGINVRQYLGTFTSGAEHVTPEQVPGDYAAIVQAMRSRQSIPDPIVVAGVSEGAALAVLAGADKSNRSWLTGVITMGLPPTAELAWRWTDITSWITKKDAAEPSFEPLKFIGAIAPTPLWMIQSTRDEYVKEADYRAFERAAAQPRRLVLIDASNHRFTDRLPLLRQQVLSGLAWIRNPS